MAEYYGRHYYENNSILCFIILYRAIYIQKILSAPGTDRINKRHSIPVVLIVIKMKLPRRHLQCLFKDTLHTLTDQLGPLHMNSNIIDLRDMHYYAGKDLYDYPG